MGGGGNGWEGDGREGGWGRLILVRVGDWWGWG